MRDKLKTSADGVQSSPINKLVIDNCAFSYYFMATGIGILPTCQNPKDCVVYNYFRSTVVVLCVALINLYLLCFHLGAVHKACSF